MKSQLTRPIQIKKSGLQSPLQVPETQSASQMSCETRNHSRENSCHAGECPACCSRYTGYRRAVAGALFTNGGTEPFPLTIASTPNGGPAFAGKSGHGTANACEAKAM